MALMAGNLHAVAPWRGESRNVGRCDEVFASDGYSNGGPCLETRLKSPENSHGNGKFMFFFEIGDTLKQKNMFVHCHVSFRRCTFSEKNGKGVVANCHGPL